MRTGHAPWSAAALVAVLAVGAVPARAQVPTTTDTARARAAQDSARRVTRSTGGEVVPRVRKDAPRAPRQPARTPAATPTTTPTPTPAAVDTTARDTTARDTTASMTPPAAAMRADSTTMGPLEAARAAVAPIVAAMRTDAHVTALLHESNLGEIEAGRRAQREASDSAVRAFAARMVEEHTTMDQQGTALAQRLNVTPMLPDSVLPQLQQRELQALPAGTPTAAPMATPPAAMRTDSAMRRPDSTMMRPDSTTMRTDSAMARTDTTMRHAGMTHGTASAFDRAYVTQQVAAHARTLALVDAAVQRAQQPELRTTLETQVRPKVAEHLRMAQDLQSRVGRP